MKFRLRVLSLVILATTGYAQDKLVIQAMDYIASPVKQKTKTTYQFIKINLDSLRKNLNKVRPYNAVNQNSEVWLELPSQNGGMDLYQVSQNSTMAPALAAKFPNIRAYNGYSTSGAKVKFDLSPKGFHAMILEPGKPALYIDPYAGSLNKYIVYDKKQLISKKRAFCGVNTVGKTPYSFMSNFFSTPFSNCELKKYRLALAATYQYTLFTGGTKESALAAQVTTVNRVNGIYEEEVGVTLELIADNANVICDYQGCPTTPVGTVPYTTGDADALILQNQTNTDIIIGSSNYDIGHVVDRNTETNGLAAVGSVCSVSQKAEGTTIGSTPVGDAFDVDFVAHEMGHQFGGTHTQNNNCNRDPMTSVEPGSGSTILGYAGICAPNVQKNSGDYFHAITLAQIGPFTQNTALCSVNTPIPNAPVITSSNANSIVPISTPFALTMTATSSASTALTYNWEQMDPEITVQPPLSTSVGGPNFRSFNPVLIGTRYFPNLESLANDGPFEWEVVPSVARVMNFRASVRNNTVGGSCNAYQDYTVTFDAQAGPFIVTSPADPGPFWQSGSQQTISWDVAGTDGGSVNESTVNILLSVDGGLSYPITIANNVPNNGSYTFTVPALSTILGRIMVIASTGTFFNISGSLAVDSNLPTLTKALRNPMKLTSAFVYFSNIPEELVLNASFTVNGLPQATASYDKANRRIVINNITNPRKVAITLGIASHGISAETNNIVLPGILG